ncbi:unnamed protein product [Arctogadus glacialis]
MTGLRGGKRRRQREGKAEAIFRAGDNGRPRRGAGAPPAPDAPLPPAPCAPHRTSQRRAASRHRSCHRYWWRLSCPTSKYLLRSPSPRASFFLTLITTLTLSPPPSSHLTLLCHPISSHSPTLLYL